MRYMKWVSIEDRLPDEELRRFKERFPCENEVGVIVMLKGAQVPYHMYYDGESFYDNEGESYDITHWMELPPAPSECMVKVDLGSFEPDFELFEAIFT